MFAYPFLLFLISMYTIYINSYNINFFIINDNFFECRINIKLYVVKVYKYIYKNDDE